MKRPSNYQKLHLKARVIENILYAVSYSFRGLVTPVAKPKRNDLYKSGFEKSKIILDRSILH